MCWRQMSRRHREAFPERHEKRERVRAVPDSAPSTAQEDRRGSHGEGRVGGEEPTCPWSLPPGGASRCPLPAPLRGLLTSPPTRGLLLQATCQPGSSLNNDVLPYLKPFHAFPIAAGITSPFLSVAPGPAGAALPRPAHDPMLCSLPSRPSALPQIMEVPHLTFCPAPGWGCG